MRQLREIAESNKTVGNIEPVPNSSLAYFLLILTQMEDLSYFFDYCRDMASSIIQTGTSVPVTASVLKKREEFHLPVLKFDKDDIKKLAKITGLTEIV